MNRDRLKAMLTRHEGRKLKPYPDTEGILTVGTGHNMEANPLPGYMAEYLKDHGELTGAMVDTLFNQDVDKAILECRIRWPNFDNFTDTRQEALADFMFQVGPGGVRKFVKANAAINAGDWGEAGTQMLDSLWARQVPKRAREITDMVKQG